MNTPDHRDYRGPIHADELAAARRTALEEAQFRGMVRDMDAHKLARDLKRGNPRKRTGRLGRDPS